MMVDFDELRNQAEKLLGDHGDQVEGGIEKLADVAGKRFGHASQIDQAAEKLEDFVDEQQARQHPRQSGAGPRSKQGGQQRPRQGKAASPRQGTAAAPKGKGATPKQGQRRGRPS